MATQVRKMHWLVAIVATAFNSLKRAWGVLSDPGHDHGAATGAGSAHTHTFTGTASTTGTAEAFTGSGYTTAGQVVTTSDNQTMTLNQCAGMWLITATQAPCLIVSNAAVTGAPAELTVYGAAPATTAEGYKILKAPTPAGTNANESAHTHSVASDTTGITAAYGGSSSVHLDASEQTVQNANASSLATSLTLVNELLAVYQNGVAGYPGHVNDTLAHGTADTTNVTLLTDPATDLDSAIDLANDLKAKYNAHRSQSGVHLNNDSGHAISSSDASDQNSLNTLLNELKTDLNAHMADAVAGTSLRAIDG